MTGDFPNEPTNVDRPANCAAVTAGWERLIGFVIGALFVIVIGGSAATTVYRLTERLLVSGPNSVGEEGKVYFARRIQRGESGFALPDRPPYYASFHGALLHAAIGGAGRLLDLAPPHLYYAGRLVSVVFTLASLVLMVVFLRQLRVVPGFTVAALAAWLSAEAIIEHGVSYRPDHWNLFLSLCAAYLLARERRPGWTIAVLAAIPVAAFFIKANGLCLMVPIAGLLALEHRHRHALWASVGSLALLSVVSMALQFLSAGQFAAGLFSAAQSPAGLPYLTALLGQSQYWLPLFFPICLLAWRRRTEEPERRVGRVLVAFWLSSLCMAILSALRAGSNLYYFVEPYTYGVLLVTVWASRSWPVHGWMRLGRRPALAGLCLLFCLHTVQPWLYLLVARPVDATVTVSRRVGAERALWAELINREGWHCYSDDAALNVMLDRPAVIYPLIQHLQLLARRLSADDVLRPVAKREYDLVLLTGLTQRYRGIDSVPPALAHALRTHYERMALDSKYQVYPGARARAAFDSGRVKVPATPKD